MKMEEGTPTAATTVSQKTACKRQTVFVAAVWSVLAVQMMVAALLFHSGEMGGSIIMVICGAAVFCTLLAPLLSTSGQDKQPHEGSSVHGPMSLQRLPAPPHHTHTKPYTFAPAGPRKTTARTPSSSSSFCAPSIAKGPVTKSIVPGPREIRCGTIVSHKETFGFIRPPQGPPDIFFHNTELQADTHYPVGVEVEFTVEHDSATGRELACQLKLAVGGCASQSTANAPAAPSTPTSPFSGTTPLYISPAWSTSRSTTKDAAERSTGQLVGTIIAQKETFGFIRPPQGPPDFFFHNTELQSGEHYPVGSEVEFDVEQDHTTGRPLAVSLKLASVGSVASAAPARLAGDGVEQYRLGHGQARAAGPAPTQALNQGYAGVVKPGYDRWNRYKDAPHTKTKAASSWRVQAKEEDPEFQGDSRWNTTGPRKTNQCQW